MFLKRCALRSDCCGLIHFSNFTTEKKKKKKMLCACSSGEQFKFEEPPPQSPDSLATRDFSASGLSSRNADWEAKFDETQVEEAESTLKEALSLNYEVAMHFFVCEFSLMKMSVSCALK